MAAGLGFKTFTTGEVLTAADVNGYLMQGVLVFASEAARNAAITSPQEGQFAFTKDNNSLWYYDGAAWVASGATGDIEGVTAGTGISGGGTSGTVTITNSMATEIDAKGDLIVGTGADTFSRLAVGTNDFVLTAASGEATGLKWAAAGGGANWSLLNAGGTTLTGAATITVSSISAKDKIMVIIEKASSTVAGAGIGIRVNSNTGSVYYRFGRQDYFANTYSAANFTTFDGADTFLTLAFMNSDATSQVNGYCLISGCNAAGVKVHNLAGGTYPASGTGQTALVLGGYINDTNTISSVSAFTDSGNFDNGKIYVYASA